MRTRLLFPIALAAACLAACKGSEPAPAVESVTIRLLALYGDSDTLPEPGRAILKAWISANRVFDQSRTKVSLELAGIRKITFSPTERIADLQALVRQRDGRMDEVHEIRDSLEADLVVLFTPLPNGTINGSVLATEATAFVIADWAQAGEPDYALAHELAHLFGAMHPGEKGAVADQLPSGFPWGDDSIRTVLDWSKGKTIPYFSNPEVSYGGKAIGVAGKQDIASVIRTTAAYISNFRGPKTATSFVPAGTIPSADFSE